MKARVGVLMWVNVTRFKEGEHIVLVQLVLLVGGSLVVGGFLLAYGAKLLVEGASALARRFGLSELVIGLTVVALGTSAPELFVSVVGALQGRGDLAVGNAVGSNIVNILLILGVTAMIRELAVNPRILVLDGPMMVLAALMVEAFAIGGTISWLEGAALLVLSGLYLTLSVRVESKGAQTIESEELVDATTLPTLWASVAKVFLSLCLLGGGSQLVIFGSVGLARAAGLSELVIGLTIVAVGTSLPEIVTSIAAACRGKSDLAVGNIVGSNILNVFVILGLSSVLAPQGLQVPEAAIMFDIPVMIGVSVAAIPIFWLGRTVSRLDALILCIGYVLYVVALLR